MIAKITALLGGLRTDDLGHASPIQRQQFAALRRHWVDLAERRNDVTKARHFV